MRRIYNIEELYGITSELLIEVVCPKCENIMISTMPKAETILVFGCTNCANIEKSTLLQLDVPSTSMVADCIIIR